MFCKAFSTYYKGFLAPITNTVTSNNYINILDNNLLSFWNTHSISEGFGLFKHDNTAIHSSKKSINWLKINQIKVINWPAMSADLNLIENLGASLKRHLILHDKNPESILELVQKVTAE